MDIPLLHIFGQFLLRPFLGNLMVPLTFFLTQPRLNLLSRFMIITEVRLRSSLAPRKLLRQIVDFRPVHDDNNGIVRPFFGLIRNILACPFDFAVEIFANMLEISENGSIRLRDHIRSSHHLGQTLYLLASSS